MTVLLSFSIRLGTREGALSISGERFLTSPLPRSSYWRNYDASSVAGHALLYVSAFVNFYEMLVIRKDCYGKRAVVIKLFLGFHNFDLKQFAHNLHWNINCIIWDCNIF